MQYSSNSKNKQLVTTIGNIVKRHRIKQNKSMYKISAEVGVPKATWRELELGVKDFRFTTIWKIAEGLEIPLDELIKELREELGDDFSLTEID
ncbi:MAG: helix-turn-helix domain-containing protein [bacterium]|nr:helix-turn-helix domain-containing protein [bacterium]